MKRVSSSINTTPIFDNQILRVEQVAELLQFSKWHVYKLVNKRKIPFRKRGHALFFLSQEIFDWINEGVQR